MAFTVGAIAAKDGAAATITGGLLALDTTGSGPWILVHSLVDGVAGSVRAKVTAANALKVAATLYNSSDIEITQNANGQATLANGAPVSVASDQTGFPIFPSPTTTGGLSLFRNLDIDESPSGQEVKATAGQLYKLRIANFATSARYVKLFNLAAASVTVGSSTVFDTIVVPAGSSTLPTIITENYGGLGLTFSTGLTIVATTALADADTGAPGTNDIIVSAYYK